MLIARIRRKAKVVETTHVSARLVCTILLFALVYLFSSCGESTGHARGDGSFGRYGTSGGEFSEPNGIAVNQRTGAVYVVDSNNSRIEMFTQAGRFVRAWGWGVANGESRILQVCSTTCFAGFEGSGAGELQFAEGIAVDNDRSSTSHDDVYVVDIGNHRVDKFSPSGRFLLMFGGGVNQTARLQHDHPDENVCPVRPGDRCGAGVEGPTDHGLELTVEGSFVAVGPSGDVYLGQRNSVREFSPDGRYRSQVRLLPALKPTESHELGGTSGLAVNASGNLYVIRNGVVGIKEYEPSGRPIRTIEREGAPAGPEGPTPTLTLSPTGELFVDVRSPKSGHRIDEYAPSGAKLASFDGGQEDGLHGIAFSQVSGKLYVVSTNSNSKPNVAHVRVVTPP